MKILYVATIGGFMPFFKSIFTELIAKGHTVDIAANMTNCNNSDFFQNLGCKIYNISCSRSPLKKGNLKAIKEIKEIVKNGEYDIVHCHTPIASACTRLACKSLRKKGLKVIYTAHGFHFYKGAPLKNWMVYYPVEKLCSHFTDLLITINKEDYQFAQKKMKAKEIVYIPGVGIDTEKFQNTKVNKAEKRKEIAVPEDAFLLLSVGELNKNKNHQVVLKAIAKLNDKNIHYAIAGQGNEMENLINLAKELGISEQLHLLGFRSDVAELYKTADCFVHPSFREGLPVSVMEAEASGLPVIGSNIRGNQDLIDENGLFPSNNEEELANKIEDAKNKKIPTYKEEQLQKLSKDYINLQMQNLYEKESI